MDLSSTPGPLSTRFRTRRLSRVFGVEIEGLDLAGKLADEDIAEIRRLWNECGLVLLREQRFTMAQHIAFSRRFGTLDLNETLLPFRHAEHPELLVLSTIPVDGKPSKSENVGRHWHTDLSYTTRPPLGSLFHCHVIPDVGGDTVFASMTAAYDALSERYKQLIDGLEAVHDYMQVENMKKRDPAMVAELKKLNPPVAQPLVRVHPETGRKGLYLGEQVARRIVGMSEEESASLLGFLHKHAVDPMFTYRHRYKVQDLILWDNRQLMHLALADFPPGAHRYCVRTTLVGTPSGRIYQG
jgi:taurine dioxygenase